MSLNSILIANRGEIAIRIARAAADLGVRSVAVYSEDDAQSLHTRRANEARQLTGVGAPAYLDAEQLVAVALEAGCDAIHPGYGFLAEHASFARQCEEAGLTFIGPRPETLELFGDKTRARALAERVGVPVLPGTSGATTLDEAREFLASLSDGQSILVKALAGGGGRGMRLVHSAGELDEAFARASSEARTAFGNGDLYVEQLMPRARHIEVQIAGDGAGAVSHFWERECSLQRRHQKLIEIAPAPGLSEASRAWLTSAAVKLAQAAEYRSLGTFEFLVDASPGDNGAAGDTIVFMETNARLQVEHTVTEEVTGVDLVQLQLRLAGGETLEALGLSQSAVPSPRGFALQARVNMETMAPDGSAKPAGGTLSAFEAPSGPGLRTDSFGYAGYATNAHFDSLLAKLVAYSPSPTFAEVARRAYRGLSEFRVEGVETNIPFLQSLLQHPDVLASNTYTRFVDDHIEELVGAANGHRRLFFAQDDVTPSAAAAELAGAQIDASDPLAVLNFGKTQGGTTAATPVPSVAAAPPAGPVAVSGPEGTEAMLAPMQGTIVSIDVQEGDLVREGQQLLIMEAMKMEHEVRATTSGIVRQLRVAVGDTVYEAHPLAFIEPAEVEAASDAQSEDYDLDAIRPDLKEVLDRRARTRDEARPQAVERRRSRGQRTARENIDDLCDEGTFVEYGPLVLANQRSRRSVEELIEKSPADGMVTGIGSINGDLFDDPHSRCAVLSYDYTVFAGTQGNRNHAKTDRMIDVAEHGRMPLVLFAEGGGGRPGDDGGGGGGGLGTFARFATLSALVPMVGITSGYCFAGNASLLGCCDVIIATANSNIGMGGPAMIEGGGLGIFRPDEIGGMDVQVPNGVVDIAVEDEREAVAVAKQYLSYFQGAVREWESPDQRQMRRIIPENRLRVYNVRDVIDTLADAGSVLEIRRGFGRGMVTAFVRVEGRPLGVIANNPMHLGGAIDSDASDKAARFMQLCDAFDIPMLFLCDTPGIMVGPEIEATALVRHSSRLFITGANLSVPFFTIVLRKSYGLGGIAMAGGSFKVPNFSVAWPTGEFGGMGLEGSVKLGYRDELAAIEDPQERTRVYDEMVARAYEHGKALNNASTFGVDDTIDPAESRWWVASMMQSVRPAPPRDGKKRPAIDAW